MRSKIWVRSIRWSSEGCRSGHNRRSAHDEASVRPASGCWLVGGLTLSSQDVEHDIGGMHAMTERFSTGGLNGQQSIGQHRVEDVDHLAIAIIGVGKLAPYTLHRGWQNPVLEGRAVAQGTGFARQHGHIMPGIVDRLAAAE